MSCDQLWPQTQTLSGQPHPTQNSFSSCHPNTPQSLRGSCHAPQTPSLWSAVLWGRQTHPPDVAPVAILLLHEKFTSASKPPTLPSSHHNIHEQLLAWPYKPSHLTYSNNQVPTLQLRRTRARRRSPWRCQVPLKTHPDKSYRLLKTLILHHATDNFTHHAAPGNSRLPFRCRTSSLFTSSNRQVPHRTTTPLDLLENLLVFTLQR